MEAEDEEVQTEVEEAEEELSEVVEGTRVVGEVEEVEEEVAEGVVEVAEGGEGEIAVAGIKHQFVIFLYCIFILFQTKWARERERK